MNNDVIDVISGDDLDALESLDPAITALFLQSTMPAVLFLRSCRHALDVLKEERNDEEVDEE